MSSVFKKYIKILIFVSFLVYLLNVLQRVIGHIQFPPMTESYWSWERNIQLVPFYFIADLITHYKSSGFDWFFWNAAKLSFYNVLLLLPMGVYLSIYKVNSIKRAAAIIFAISIGIELLQVLLSYCGIAFRTFNVDDLILNTVGGVLGYVVFEQFKKVYNSIRSE